MSEIKIVRRRLMAQYSTKDYCLCSEDHFVYRYLYQTGQLRSLFRLPCLTRNVTGTLKDAVLRSRLLRAFRRNLGISNVVELPSGTVLALYDRMYRYAQSDSSGIADPTVSWEAFNFYPPLKNGIAVNPDNNCVYFGEYQNSRPYAAKIMRVFNDGRQAEICYTFPEGSTKHIHSVTWDPFRKRLWVATGDFNTEVGLYYTDDDFRTLSYFNGGSQTWRMVSVLPTENALYWGSDAGKDASKNDENFIFCWNFGNNHLEKMCDIGNPAYYSVSLDNGGMLVGTTFEPGMKQETEPCAALWYSAQGKRWEKLCSLPYKNLQKSQRTQYATINLPMGELPQNTTVFTPLNTERWDFDLLTLRR